MELDFEFEEKPQARDIMFQIQDLFRNWNYAPADSDEYKNFVKQIDEFIAVKGRGQE